MSFTFPVFTVSSSVFQKWMALAMFDNLADSTDELSFRRGDTLTVLEQNTGGLDGWWLCSFRGRQVRVATRSPQNTGGLDGWWLRCAPLEDGTGR